MSRRLAAGLSCAVVLAGCGTIADTITGSGELVTESREVSGFDEVVLQTSGDVTIDVTGTESLTVEAEDGVVDRLTTEVSGGRLELGARRGLRTTRGIDYTITAAELTAVTVTGSGDVEVTGVDADDFEATISGSGRIVPTGTTDALDVDISGSGSFEGEDLLASSGSVRVSGSGDVVVNVSDDLEVSISGSGDVQYLGDPSVDRSVTGSGSVTQR